MQQQPAITPADQYREVAASRRNHDLIMWQTLAVAVAVDGLLLIQVLGTRGRHLFLLEAFLALAALFTAVLMYALIAHRHWAVVEQRTLEILETRYAQQRVHWGGKVPKGKESDFYYPPKRPWWYILPAHVVYVGALAVVLTLIVLVFIMGLAQTTWIKAFFLYLTSSQ